MAYVCPAHPDGSCPRWKDGAPDTPYGRAYLQLKEMKRRLNDIYKCYRTSQNRADLRALVIAIKAMKELSGCHPPCEILE